MSGKPNAWFLKQWYGHVPTETNLDSMQRFGKALMCIVGADGLSPGEREFFIAMGQTGGVPQEIIDGIVATDVKKESLDALLKGIKDTPLARVMLFDAITVAHADGVYSAAEKAEAARAAKLLGIDDSTLATIEGLVEMDENLRRTRASLLFGTASR